MGDQARRGVGYRFCPTQQELFYLLQIKARGGEISAFTDCILEKNLYGKEEGMEPWNLFSDVDSGKWGFYDEVGKNDNKRVLYIVTKLSKMSAKKMDRKAGIGTWDGKTEGKSVMDYQNKEIVGYTRILTYLVDSGYELEAASQCHWYMHQYSLSEHSLTEIGITSTDYVLCRIIRDDSKSCSVRKPRDDSKSCGVKKKRDDSKSCGARKKARAINSGDYVGGTSGSSIRPQQDYRIPVESNLEQQQYDGAAGSFVEEFPQFGEGGAGIRQEEYLENQCWAPSGVGVSSSDREQSNATGYCYDLATSAPTGMPNQDMVVVVIDDEKENTQQVDTPSADDVVVIIDDEEDNTQQQASPANTIPATVAADLFDLEQFISPGFWQSLVEDNAGLSTPQDDWFAQAEDFWCSSICV